MSYLVLVRHGQSRWNLENRFTGWVDVPLSEDGIHEAERCAHHCQRFDFQAAFSSDLERAHETLLIILAHQQRTGIVQHEEEGQYKKWIRASNICVNGDVPIYNTHHLNERFYGALQGMKKEQAIIKYGLEKTIAWRRGYEDTPPHGESLKDAHDRMHPYLIRHILPKVKAGMTVLVTAHGNTLRAVIKHLEGISDEAIASVDLPEAAPIVYQCVRGKFVHVAGEYHMDRPLR